MGINMSTLVGWVAVLGLFGAYGFREWTKGRPAQLARPGQPRLRQEHHLPSQRKDQKEAKPKRARANEAAQNGKTAAAAAAAPQPQAAYSYSSDDDDAASNREFARQLASVKQGTKFTGKAKDETRQKSVKQSRAEELPVSADSGVAISTSSSTAGIDADDDRSSAASPVLAATAVTSAVDDMLEKPAPGPSVLRLTASEEKKQPAKPKPKAAAEPVETKKQRQNRKKAELAKAAREEAEAERKVKQEAQRRAARLAEGRAAKDGSAFVAAKAKSNAWKGDSKAATATTNGFLPSQPLDTFDANAVQTDASKSSARSGDKSVDKADDWMSSLPSEEEQMEMLRKEEDSWSTVKPKSRKVKTAEQAENGKAAAAAATPTAAAAAPVTVSSSKGQKPFTQKSAFAALSTETEEAVEEEAEWDV